MARPEPGAAVFVEDLPEPQAGPGQVRVRISKAAICGTDRHIFHWDPSIAPLLSPPVVIGHEFCGHIDQVGAEVTGWEEGDYVSAEMHIVCGKCRACRAGNQHVCEDTEIAGLHCDGAFAEFVVVPSQNLVRLDPAVVPPHIGAFLDALGNAVHTVQAASSIAGRHILLSGYGAIGAMAAAVVEFEGAASLCITEVAPGHLSRAREWVSTLNGPVPVHVFDPREEGTAEKIRQITGGGVDVVLEMSGAPPAINMGLELLYPGGEMMMLGLPSGSDLSLEGFARNVIFKGLHLHGVVGRRIFATWTEMLGLLARGLNIEHIVTHRLPLSSFTEGIGLLDAAEAHKVILDPTT